MPSKIDIQNIPNRIKNFVRTKIGILGFYYLRPKRLDLQIIKRQFPKLPFAHFYVLTESRSFHGRILEEKNYIFAFLAI